MYIHMTYNSLKGVANDNIVDDSLNSLKGVPYDNIVDDSRVY